MLLFLVLKKVKVELIEDLKTIPLQNQLMIDHLPKAPIHHPQEGRDQGITVQDLMINKSRIIYLLFLPIPKKVSC